MTSRSFSRVLSLSVRLLAATCGAAIGVTTLPGCTRCPEYSTEMVLVRDTSPTTVTLRGVAARGLELAVAVGDGGTVISSFGGQAWQANDSGVSADLHAIAQATDYERFVAVGDGGAVVVMDPVLEGLTAIDTGVDADLRAVVFASATVVIAVGPGTILRSDDAGDTWAPVAGIDGAATLRAVGTHVRPNGDVELLAAGDEVAYHSVDDGVTWSPVALPAGLDVLAIGSMLDVVDGEVWLLVGAGGEVLRGPLGDLQEADAAGEIRGRGLTPDGAWVVGEDGRVLAVGYNDGPARYQYAGQDEDGAELLAVSGDGSSMIAVGAGGAIVRGVLESNQSGSHLCNTHIVEGRPFVVADEVRIAAAVRRDDWHAPATVRPVAPEIAARLAAAWQRDGLYEHASVASFARFVLQLLAVGAPSALVLDGQAAIADEVRHAQDCFALASAYAGAPIGPGPLAIEGSLAGPCDLAALAGATAVEGCVNETIAALIATTAAALAEDPAVAGRLAVIAADEQRHAALAWRTVAWALDHGDEQVHAAVARAFAAAPSQVDEHDEDGLEVHGRLSRRARAAVARAAWREVIAPQARRLLARRRTAANARAA